MIAEVKQNHKGDKLQELDHTNFLSLQEQENAEDLVSEQDGSLIAKVRQNVRKATKPEDLLHVFPASLNRRILMEMKTLFLNKADLRLQR